MRCVIQNQSLSPSIPQVLPGINGYIASNATVSVLEQPGETEWGNMCAVGLGSWVFTGQFFDAMERALKIQHVRTCSTSVSD